MQGKLAILAFTGFVYLLIWLALAITVVPDLAEGVTEDVVIRALLNVGISGSLFAIPFYTLYRLGIGGPGRPMHKAP